MKLSRIPAKPTAYFNAGNLYKSNKIFAIFYLKVQGKFPNLQLILQRKIPSLCRSKFITFSTISFATL
ncbi:MAG: hypothetical protein IJB95_04645, partial [Clostridia bacterium]|nr:hypothetical protein [Clostridia bacterium]